MKNKIDDCIFIKMFNFALHSKVMRFSVFFMIIGWLNYSQTPPKPNDLIKKTTPPAQTIESKKSEDGFYELPKDTVIFKIITATETPKPLIQKAYFYGYKLLSACNHSKISKFNENDFSATIFKKLNLDYISNVCRNINREFDEFQDLRFVETIENEKTKVKILRFKCIYKKKYSTKELRVAFDPTGKIVGLKTLKWQAEFEPLEKKPKKLYAQEIDQKILDSLDKLINDLDFN